MEDLPEEFNYHVDFFYLYTFVVISGPVLRLWGIAQVFLAKPKGKVVPSRKKNISSYQLYALFMSAISFIIEARSENVSKKEVRLSISQKETFLLAGCPFFA